MKYFRFVRPNTIENLGAREGLFCAAYELRSVLNLEDYISDELEDLLSWFRANLTIPDKFNSSKSNGSRDKNTAGLSWFKEDASDAIGRSYELINLLKENGYPIEIIRTERVGYVVYEDDQQVVAEPFSDTPV
ncbi:hypothetical protein N9L47_07840 [Rhodobacteraceae bacterium]|nr:hypothetical protein [Paracoccaceae bacterium]